MALAAFAETLIASEDTLIVYWDGVTEAEGAQSHGAADDITIVVVRRA